MAATPCSGIPLSERDLVTTYDSALDYTMTIDSSQPFGQKTKRILHKDIFAGWTNGNMTIQNNTNSGQILFNAKNSSGVLKNLFQLQPNQNRASVSGFFGISSSGDLTIASGAITVTGSKHIIDTEGGAATDDLTQINGGLTDDILILTIQDNARNITLKDDIGNLRLAGDFTMTNVNDIIMLIKIRSDTIWYELSRSKNT